MIEYEVIGPGFHGTGSAVHDSQIIGRASPQTNTPVEPNYVNAGVEVQTAIQENQYEKPHVSTV